MHPLLPGVVQVQVHLGLRSRNRKNRTRQTIPLRPGGQSQHSALLELIGANNRFKEILIWARSHLNEPLDVERLAERAALSVRQFTRAFTASIGMAPAKAIERLVYAILAGAETASV